MSDYRAIQGVTASIRRLLETHMFLNRASVPPANRIPITALLPHVPPAEAGRRVNLFLYHLRESACLKNQDLPGAATLGERGRPPLSLELHYLLTAYTEEDDSDQLEAQQILGDAMRTLHDHSFILGGLLDASLEDAFERITVTMEPLTVEDVTKVWVALNTPYRLSVGYKITVVQIESRIERTYARLVGEGPGGGARVTALPMRIPRINEVRVVRNGDPSGRERTPAYAQIGDTLVLAGLNFSGDAVRVLVSGSEIPAAGITRSETRIEFVIPDLGAIQPGVNLIQVVADLLLGDPPVPHTGFTSNAAPFMLTPLITGITPDLGVVPRTLTIDGVRLFLDGRNCAALIGDTNLGVFTTQTPTQLVCSLPASLGSGTYPVRVRANGAESLNAVDLVIP